MIKNIKNYIKRFKKCFALSYFILIMLIFLPSAITMPSLSFRGAIITAIGIDKIDDQVEFSVLTLSDISKDNMGENTKVVCGKSNSVANAISSIESQIGRSLKMGHVGYVVVSQSFAEDDIASVLNTLTITTKLPNSVSLILSRDSAKDVLNQASKLEQSSMYKLREIIQNEFNVNYTKDTSLDNFLKGYFSETKTSTLGYIKLENDISQGISADQQSNNSGQSTEQSSEGGNQSNSNGIISLQREHAVFVEGKLKYILNVDEMKGINWIVENDLQQLLTIDNVNEQGLSNASISFEVQQNQIKPSVIYRNNRPIITFELSLKLNTVEIMQVEKQTKSPKDIYISDIINNKINDKIKREVALTLNKLRQEKTDVIGVYKILFSDNHKKFFAFLDSLKDKEDFLSYVKINIKADAKIFAS